MHGSIPDRIAPRHGLYSDIELMRGLAAIAVFLFHFLRAVMPPQDPSDLSYIFGVAMERPFILAFINGHFMVSLFFVLSSFAITQKILTKPDAHAAFAAILKRLPRLLPLTLCGTILAGLLYTGGLMVNREAAELTGSVWMQNSAGLKLGAGWPAPSLLGSVFDGFAAFERGLSQYNSALWTMKYELIGSIVALVTALAIAGPVRILRDIIICGGIALMVIDVHVLCALCAITVGVTKYMLRWQGRLGGIHCAGLIVTGLILGSTYKPFPPYLLEDEWVRIQILRADWILLGTGALALFIGIRNIAARYSHVALPGSTWLGRLSFPIYVLHVPIIGSVGASILIAGQHSMASVLTAFIASATVTLLLALPVSALDRWWTAWLNRMTKRLFPSKPDTLAAEPS